jgi:two-component system, LytTR family, response regulator
MPSRDGRGGIRAAIVDDEPLARDCIRLALAGADDVEIVAECGDGAAAVRAIEALRPDLIFLDVQMPGLDGFEVVKAVGPDRMPAVMFVTAYDAHAIQAFELHATDYLLKPFSDARFGAAMGHARARLREARESELGRRLTRLVEEIRPGRDPSPGEGAAASPRGGHATRILVRHGSGMEFLPLDTVDWIEAAGNYLRLHAGPRTESVRMTLAGLLDQLDPTKFVRIHRSMVVNLSRIRSITPWFGGDYTVTLIDGRDLRVSRHYRDELLRPLG